MWLPLTMWLPFKVSGIRLVFSSLYIMNDCICIIHGLDYATYLPQPDVEQRKPSCSVCFVLLEVL